MEGNQDIDKTKFMIKRMSWNVADKSLNSFQLISRTEVIKPKH